MTSTPASPPPPSPPSPPPPPRNARLEALGLAAVAVVAVIAFHLVLMAPFIVFVAANPYAYRYGIWPMIGLLLVVWWLLLPNRTSPGVALSRTEAPGLYEAVEALRMRIGAPPIDAIRTIDEFNAAAMEERLPWQPWRKRRVLLLGVPLLALVDVATARSVIAHELGHFSHRHGRLGQWIYRARVAWLDYAEMPRASTALVERAAGAFARWFAPRFSRLAFAYSRRCEFEADAYGAAVVGPLAMASGLFTIEAFGGRWQQMSKEELPRLIAATEAPPASWLHEVQRRVATRPAERDEWERLRLEAAAQHDTHPSLGERIGALGVSEQELLESAVAPERAAGADWIVDWPATAARHDADWAALHARSWRREHIRGRHQRQRLESLRTRHDESLERALLELEHGSNEVAVDLVRTRIDEPGAAALARFVLGSAQLAARDATGLATLESCVAADPTWAAPARLRIAAHATLLPEDAARRNEALLDRARRRHALAREQVLQSAIPRGELEPAPLDDVSRAILSEVLCKLPAIAAAWCASVPALVQDERRYAALVLVLRLRTEHLLEGEIGEDHVVEDAMELLEAVLPPDRLKVVWTAYSTEPLSPALDARLSARASGGDRCCLVQPTPGESVGPGVHAAALG